MKIAKLSLVAAVAVAGLSTANAQPLEEAIKNVDVTGSVVYRYNDYNDNDLGSQANSSSSTNYYKAALGLASKVNDDVKLNTRFLVANSDGGFAANGLNTQTGSDANVDVELSNVYFGYTGLANTTVNVGKQGLTTPWTMAVDSDGNEQTGTGILALTTQGPVTLAGAYFNQTNLQDGASTGNITVGDGSEDVMTVGAIAKLGMVTVDAWYVDVQDILDSYTVGAAAKFDVSDIKMGADARYTSLDTDGVNQPDNSLAKITLTADAGLIDAKVAYATTDKEGGLVALDNDASTTILGWNIAANNKKDADYYQLVLGFDVLSNLNLSANYGNIDYKSGTDSVEEEEVYAQLVYKMSKNLSSYVRYGTYTKETTTTAGVRTENNDDTRGRLQVEYTF